MTHTLTDSDCPQSVRDQINGDAQPTTQAIEKARAFAVIDPHWGEPRIMPHTIRPTREEVLEAALWDRGLSLYSAAHLERVPPTKGQWERLERQGFKIEEVSIEALLVSASEREALEKALQMIATGEIAGEATNYRDTVAIMRDIARAALDGAKP